MSTAKSPVPAYTITEVEVVDADGYQRYRELAQAAVAQHGVASSFAVLSH